MEAQASSWFGPWARWLQMAPFPTWHHPRWPCLLGAKKPSFLCLLCTHFSQSAPFPCPCKPSGYPPATQRSVKDQDLWRSMILQLFRPTWGRSVSGGSQLCEKSPTDFHTTRLLLEIVQYFVCHFQNSFSTSYINPDTVNSRQQFSSSVLKNKKNINLFLLNHFNQQIFSRTHFFFHLLHANSGELQLLPLLNFVCVSRLPYTVFEILYAKLC